MARARCGSACGRRTSARSASTSAWGSRRSAITNSWSAPSAIRNSFCVAVPTPPRRRAPPAREPPRPPAAWVVDAGHGDGLARGQAARGRLRSGHLCLRERGRWPRSRGAAPDRADRRRRNRHRGAQPRRPHRVAGAARCAAAEGRARGVPGLAARRQRRGVGDAALAHRHVVARAQRDTAAIGIAAVAGARAGGRGRRPRAARARRLLRSLRWRPRRHGGGRGNPPGRGGRPRRPRCQPQRPALVAGSRRPGDRVPAGWPLRWRRPTAAPVEFAPPQDQQPDVPMGRGPSIEARKNAVDAQRGKIFTKVIREIGVAARSGGSDASSNPRLRAAIDRGLQVNMSKDVIERAIKKATGELEGVTYEEIRYEGYAPGGVAVIVDCLTDNKVRTVADVRHAFGKFGGNLGTDGSVSFMFRKLGVLSFAAGADDVVVYPEDGAIDVLTAPDAFEAVKAAMDGAGLKPDIAEVSLRADNDIAVSGETAQQVAKLLRWLEDMDDVQNVYSNADLGADAYAA